MSKDAIKLQLVSGPRLLETMWPDTESRPSLRWLRDRQADRSIPFVKLGGRVWFDLDEAGRAIVERWTIRGRSLPQC